MQKLIDNYFTLLPFTISMQFLSFDMGRPEIKHRYVYIVSVGQVSPGDAPP